MTGTQTVEGMLGYTFKKKDAVGFIEAYHGYTVEEIEEGRNTYALMNASALKARKNISVTGWAKAVWGNYEKYLFPWQSAEDTLAVTILVMVKLHQAYIGDGWARLGNSLNEEKGFIATKSVFQPLTVTLADVRYAIFNESTKVEVDSDDDTCPFQDQDDYVPIKKVKYEYLTPRQLPCGNRPTDVVWTSEHDNQYTADELLRLAKDQRLQREADRRRPASPSTPDSEPPISEDDF